MDIDATACRSDRLKRLENKLVPVLHRRFCDRYSFGHKFMLEVNPYEPTTICEIASAPPELEGHSCPSCTQTVSRWKIWKSIASGNCGKCDSCGEKLWIELPRSFSLVLILVGLGICGIWWVLSELMGTSLNFMLLIMPLALTSLSCWMQIAFGKLASRL